MKEGGRKKGGEGGEGEVEMGRKRGVGRRKRSEAGGRKKIERKEKEGESQVKK